MIGVLMKLVSGEELFTMIEDITEDRLSIIHPMKVDKVLTSVDNKLIRKINYEPYMDYGISESHLVYRKHIMFCEPLSENLIELYKGMILELDSINSIKESRLNTTNIH